MLTGEAVPTVVELSVVVETTSKAAALDTRELDPDDLDGIPPGLPQLALAAGPSRAIRLPQGLRE